MMALLSPALSLRLLGRLLCAAHRPIHRVQCDETSSRARAVVSAAASRVLTSWAITSLSIVAGQV
jgi:hypothetical protein